MLENIALIKEFHEFLPIPLAQKEAFEYLKKIDLQNISLYRLTQCSSLDIFYVCLIRALMTKEMNVIIVMPFNLVDNLKDIKKVFKTIDKLEVEKNILILDLISNETHYKGCSCNIIK